VIRSIILLLCCVAILCAERKAIRPPSSPTAGPYSAGIVTDQFVYVSGHVGPEPGGKFAPGDVQTQTRRCLELVRKVLVEAGLDYQNVVSTTLYLTDIRTLPAADAAYREVFTSGLPARTEIESTLLIPEALSEVSAIAYRGDPRSIIYVRPPGWAVANGPFSHAVSAGGTLFFSTLRPVDPASGKLIGESIQAQAEQLLRNQQGVLSLMKAMPAVSRLYVTDSSYAPAAGKVLKADSTIVMTPSAPGHLLQMQSIAGREAGQLQGFAGRGASGDIRTQTRQALDAITQQLAAKKMTFENVLETVVFIRDPRHAAEMNAVYREIVKPNPPARATVRIAPLSPQSLIEIVMTAGR